MANNMPVRQDGAAALPRAERREAVAEDGPFGKAGIHSRPGVETAGRSGATASVRAGRADRASYGYDGCSGGVDWFYRRILRRSPPFGFCCDEHDLAYDEGGGCYDRWLADWRFARCLWEADRRGKAVLFWLFVRLFGWLFWGKEEKSIS